MLKKAFDVLKFPAGFIAGWIACMQMGDNEFRWDMVMDTAKNLGILLLGTAGVLIIFVPVVLLVLYLTVELINHAVERWDSRKEREEERKRWRERLK